MKKNREDMYTDFRNSECKEFRVLGVTQMILIILMVVCLLLLMWIDIYLFLRIELTLFSGACIIAVVYHHMDKFYRNLFDEEYEKL